MPKCMLTSRGDFKKLQPNNPADLKRMELEWKNKWPTQVGCYWFYGYPYGRGSKPEWNFINVIKISNGTMVTRNGAFWFEKEGWIGRFSEIQLPQPPDI